MIYRVRDDFRVIHAQFAPLQLVFQISFGKGIRFNMLDTLQEVYASSYNRNRERDREREDSPNSRFTLYEERIHKLDS